MNEPTISELIHEAVDGNAQAAAALAREYESGRRVTHDELEAHHWLRKAAKLRHPASMVMLGDEHLLGNPKDSDLIKAARLFYRAAKAGDPDALARLQRLIPS